MSKLETLTRTETDLATARGLMEIVHFVFDHSSDDDWLRIKTSFGFLLNSLSAELSQTNAGFDTLYTEHFAANGNAH